MQSTISMGKAPAVRASRALQSVNVRKMYARAISLARSKSLTIAVISAGISLKPAGTAINFREFAIIPQFLNYCLRISRKFRNFVTQQIMIVSLSRTGAVNARNIVGLFLWPDLADNTAAFRNSFALERDSIMICCNGRQPFLLNATNHDTMQTISLKPAGTAINFRELFSLIGSFIKSHSIVLAVISAAVSYTGILFDSGIVNALGAFVALSFVCIADTTQKGGER